MRILGVCFVQVSVSTVPSLHVASESGPDQALVAVRRGTGPTADVSTHFSALKMATLREGHGSIGYK